MGRQLHARRRIRRGSNITVANASINTASDMECMNVAPGGSPETVTAKVMPAAPISHASHGDEINVMHFSKNGMRFSVIHPRIRASFNVMHLLPGTPKWHAFSSSGGPRHSPRPSYACKVILVDKEYIPLHISRSVPDNEVFGQPNTPARTHSRAGDDLLKYLGRLHIRRAAAQTRTVSAVRFWRNSPNLLRHRRRILVLSDFAVRIRCGRPRSRSLR